jgi:hypothetical protein
MLNEEQNLCWCYFVIFDGSLTKGQAWADHFGGLGGAWRTIDPIRTGQIVFLGLCSYMTVHLR